jgi:hypothetical protein
MLCVYHVPPPPAIHKAAARNELNAEPIIELRVLEPYFYT